MAGRGSAWTRKHGSMIQPTAHARASAYKGDDREGSTTKAIAEYQTLVRLSPADQDVRLMLGRLLLQDDRPAEALEQFQAVKAAGFDPVQTGLLIARGLLREQKNDE